jgi:Tfp pilus assembly protein PilF
MLLNTLKKALVPAIATLYLYDRWKQQPALQAPLPKRTLSPYRPNDWLHVHYAVQVYENNGGKVEPGWELVRTHPENSGYFGAAYRHPQHRHVIIAHRGTEKDLKDLLTDLDVITRRLSDQQASAWDNFAKKIIEEHGSAYTYSFTGHSLGGWLAEACLWKYQDQFVRDQAAYPDAFSVTLDDPGGKELLEALQPRTETDYEIPLNTLDRTNYVSRPHIINTALGRKGSTTYALLPEIESSWLMRNTLLFTAKMHSSVTLLKEFDKETGLPKKCYRVLDWPRVRWGKAVPSSDDQKSIFGYLAHAIKAYQAGDIQRGEYLGFYTYPADKVDNPEALPAASRFQLQHGIHYRTTVFQPEVLPLRNMPSVVRKFLKDLSDYTDRATTINELLDSSIEPELANLLNIYQINDRQECVLNPGMSARIFREHLLIFLSQNPTLYQNKLVILQNKYILKQAKTNNLEAVLVGLSEQIQRSKESVYQLPRSKELQLVYDLSDKQGSAQLYKFIKPSLEEIRQLEYEQLILKQQLTILQDLKLTLQTLQVLSPSLKNPVLTLLQQHERQLQLAEINASILISYMQNNHLEADKKLNTVISTLEDPSFVVPDLNKAFLLNRAYNLKAKIAAQQGDIELAKTHYQKAIAFLSTDVLTNSNYGGLLIDLGRAERNPKLYVKACECFQKVYPYLDQIEPTQAPIAYTGMAYGFILLAQSLDRKEINTATPNSQQLRSQAQNLLKRAIEINPHYLNAHLFSAILGYDTENYENALQEINIVLSMQPSHPTVLMRKGFILEKLEQPSEALEALSQAKQLLEAYPMPKANEGWIKEIENRITEIEKKRKPKPS